MMDGANCVTCDALACIMERGIPKSAARQQLVPYIPVDILDSASHCDIRHSFRLDTFAPAIAKLYTTPLIRGGSFLCEHDILGEVPIEASDPVHVLPVLPAPTHERPTARRSFLIVQHFFTLRDRCDPPSRFHNSCIRPTNGISRSTVGYFEHAPWWKKSQKTP